MTTKMTTTSEPPVLNNVVTPVQLLQMAVSQGADLDKLQQLMDLQQQWEENEARKAYHAAVAEFKTESIQIMKNKRVSFDTSAGKTKYDHATLDHILEITVPILAKYGLSHSWNPVNNDDTSITVSCILTHSLGYSQRVHLTSFPDDSGKKNNIQRMASAISYLERYTFLAITGLAAKDQDDDGQATGEREGFAEGLAYGMACYQHKEIIEQVKDRIADNDLYAAVESLNQLTNEEKISIWRAPSKGGIFTTEERKIMKSDEWGRIAREIKNNSCNG